MPVTIAEKEKNVRHAIDERKEVNNEKKIEKNYKQKNRSQQYWIFP